MSHVHYTLRIGLFIKEFKARVNSPVQRGDRRSDRPRADPGTLCRATPRADDGLSAPKPPMRLSPRPTRYQGLTNTGSSSRIVTATPTADQGIVRGRLKDMAVGIFDSGLGGLTVLSAVEARLPDLPLVYFGDNAHTPYGVRDADDIYDLTTRGVQALFDMGCDLVILACNTASAAALRRMQEGWVPQDKRVLGVFVPLIEALTERKWGDNSPPREVAVEHVALFATPRPSPAARSSANWPFAPSVSMSRHRPAAASSTRSRWAT
jgi:hypothetical protein